MSWDNGTVGGLLAAEQYKKGRIGPEPLKGLVDAARHNQATADQPVPREITLSSPVTDWATSQTLVTGPGRLFKVRVENKSTDPIYAVFADNVIQQVIAAVQVPVGAATVATTSEATLFSDPGVTGEAFATSLICRVRKIDGTGTTAASNAVPGTTIVVKLLVG